MSLIDFTRNYLVSDDSNTNYLAISVPNDGNCFFHAISHFVEDDHEIIRRKCNKYVIANKEYFVNFMQDNVSIDTYC